MRMNPEDPNLKTQINNEDPDFETCDLETEATEVQSTPEEKKPRRKSHVIRNILVVFCIFLAAFGIYDMFAPKKGKDYTIVVFGVDSRNGNLGKDALSDVNMIVHLDSETGEVKIVSVYRDTYVKISKDGTYHKFNEAYFRGGPEQAIWMIENNLDIHPEDYITFNWKAVIDAVNIMGGVDLNITEPEFRYINSFITETVNSTGVGSVQLEHAGENHLDGVQAVAYARLRYMDSDYNRTERQRRVVGLLVDKIKKAGLSKRLELLNAVMNETSTSMTIDDLIPLAKNADKYHIGETAGFPFDKVGVDVGKKDCVVAVTLETNVMALHTFLFGDTGYSVPASVKEISEKIIRETGLTGKGAKPAVKTDSKDNAPIGPTALKNENETQPAVKIEATAKPISETEEKETKETETSKSAETTAKQTVSSKSAETTSASSAKKTTAAENYGPGVKSSSGSSSAGAGKSSESGSNTAITVSSGKNAGPGIK